VLCWPEHLDNPKYWIFFITLVYYTDYLYWIILVWILEECGYTWPCDKAHFAYPQCRARELGEPQSFSLFLSLVDALIPILLNETQYIFSRQWYPTINRLDGGYISLLCCETFGWVSSFQQLQQYAHNRER